MTSSGTSIMNGFSDKFMGIYSGRIQDGDIIDMSNLGMVWKPSVIDMLFE
jgi:hypothetical protein